MTKPSPSLADGPPLVKIITGYTTVADFVHGFCRVVDEAHILIGLTRPHPVGHRFRFAIQLASGKPVFEGQGRIVTLLSARHRRAVLGAKVAIEQLEGESRTMLRCLLMARQALLLTRAADDAGFSGDVPDYARAALPRVDEALPRTLATGTQPNAPTLMAFGEEPDRPTAVATRIVAGTLFSRGARLVALPRVEDSESEPTRQLTIPSPLESSDDGASSPSSAAPEAQVVQDTERIVKLEAAPAPEPTRRSPVATIVTSLLLMLAVVAMIGGALRFL